MNDSPPSPAYTSAAFLILLGAVALPGCAEESQEIITIPGHPPFNVTVSPGVAPGLADGCDGESLPSGRLRGLVYYIAPETRLLPALDALAPVEAICLDRLDVTPRRSVYPALILDVARPGDEYRVSRVDEPL